MDNKNSQNFGYWDFLQLAISQNNEEVVSQQNLLQQYSCQMIDHKNKQIDGICINETCTQANRRACSDCIIEKNHDNDNGWESVIKNADQLELMIQQFKIGLNQEIDTYQCGFYFEQLELCNEAKDILASIKLQELNKIKEYIQKQKQLIRDINFSQYLSQQYNKNIGLFSYLQDQKKSMKIIDNQIKKYRKIKMEIKYLSSNLAQYLKVENNILKEFQELKKKKIFIIESILKTNEFKNGNLYQNQRQYLIQNIEEKYYESKYFNQDHIIYLQGLLFQLYPQDAVYYCNKGNALYAIQKYDQAITMYDQAIQLNPKNSDFYNNKGDALYGIQKYDQAISMYDQAIQINPKNADYYNNKGSALRQIQIYYQSIFMYDQAIQLNPKNDDYFYNKGYALYQIQKYDQAISMYDEAIQLNPQNAQYYYNKGVSLYIIQKYEQAIFMYDQAIQLNPKNADYYNNKGTALYEIQKFDQAIFMYDQAIQLNPQNADYYNNKGYALDDMQKYDQAISMYDQAIQLKPQNATYYNNKGTALYQMQQYDQAISMYNQAIQIDPKELYLKNREQTVNKQKPT